MPAGLADAGRHGQREDERAGVHDARPAGARAAVGRRLHHRQQLRRDRHAPHAEAGRRARRSRTRPSGSPTPRHAHGDRDGDERGRRSALHGQRHRQLRDQAATAPIVSNLRKPPVFRGHPPWLWDSKYWFWVKPGPTGDVSAAHGRGARHQAGARAGAGGAREERHLPDAPVGRRRGPTWTRTGTARTGELICPRHIRTWPDGASVGVRPMGGREVPAFVKVMMEPPARRPDAPLLAQEDPDRPRHQGPAGRSADRAGPHGRPLRPAGGSSRSAASRSSPPLCRAENRLRNVLPPALGGP